MVSSRWSRNRCLPLKNLWALKASTNISTRDNKVKQLWLAQRTLDVTKTIWRARLVILFCQTWRAYHNVATTAKYMKTIRSLGAAFQFISVKRSTKVRINWMRLQAWQYGASIVLLLMVHLSPAQLHIKIIPEALSSWIALCWICLSIASESRSPSRCLTISGKPP